jgi:MFS family permease
MSDLKASLLKADEKAYSIKNIILLAIAWAFTLTTSTLLTTIGPLSATELGASDSMAAFTIGTFLIGAALSSVPSARLFSTYGRFYGFSIGCLCQILGSITGAAAMGLKFLPIVFLGCFFVGLGQGLGQFYRFSAVEISSPEQKSKAITYVLSGGVIAAFLGPVCADNTANLDKDHKFLGSYLIIALIGLMNEITICFVDFPKPFSSRGSDVQNIMNTSEGDESEESALHVDSANIQKKLDAINAIRERTAYEIVTQPLFLLSCFVATMAHTIMVMLMSDVTLAMDDYGYSLAATSLVMELHFFSMFGPGFFTGKLILRYGSFSIALIGGVILGAAAGVFLIKTDLWNFYLGMILLGVGWNFSFSAGTVMLTDSYQVRNSIHLVF